MEEFRHKVTRKLSSGQSTRLGLAKAFLTEPKILFSMSRPRVSDPDIAQKIRSFLKEERRSSGLSVLYTVAQHARDGRDVDRIIFLQRGQIVAEGDGAGDCGAVWRGGLGRSVCEVGAGKIIERGRRGRSLCSQNAHTQKVLIRCAQWGPSHRLAMCAIPLGVDGGKG